MSAETPAPDNAEPKMPTKWLHHFDKHCMWGLLAFLVANTVLGSLGASDIVFWAVVAAQAPYLVAVLVATRKHQPGFCMHCAEEFPINPGEHAIGRTRFALRYVHLVVDGMNGFYRFMSSVFRVKLVATIMFYVVLFAAVFGLGFLAQAWSSVVILALMMSFGHAYARHRQFSIWCPWCHQGNNGGGGDDDPPQPEPDPDPAINAKTDQLSKTG